MATVSLPPPTPETTADSNPAQDSDLLSGKKFCQMCHKHSTFSISSQTDSFIQLRFFCEATDLKMISRDFFLGGGG